ncbi:hypothetical protein GF406_15410 [candidate division KSB1 bacterium]|nr:hypothetical protein [candidate division KSB1 bacterium]
MKDFRQQLIILTVALLFLLLLFIPLPRKIKAPCLIFARHQWRLQSDQPDRIVATWQDHLKRSVVQFDLYQFDRPDFVHFRPQMLFSADQSIQENQVVGGFYSFETQRLLESLESDLAVARAKLAVLQSGAKTALLKQAEQAVRLARRSLESVKTQTQRVQFLAEQQLVSTQELEDALSRMELAEIKLALKESELNVIKTGAKPQEIKVVLSDIKGLQSQIELLKKKEQNHMLRAPFSGIHFPSGDQQTLINIQNIDTLVAQIPLLANRKKAIVRGHKVALVFDDIRVYSRVAIISRNAEMIAQQPRFIISCLISGNDNLRPGMSGQAFFQLPSRPLWRHFADWIPQIYSR